MKCSKIKLSEATKIKKTQTKSIQIKSRISNYLKPRKTKEKPNTLLASNKINFRKIAYQIMLKIIFQILSV